MKKTILAVLLLAGLIVAGPGDPCPAATLADTFGTTAEYVKANFVFLQEVQGGFLLDIKNGESHTEEKGPFFNIEPHGILTADVGYVHRVDNSDGSVLLGTSLRANKLLAVFVPQIGEAIDAATPDVTHTLINHIWIGFDVSRDFENNRWIYGPSAGLKWLFGGML